MKYFIKKAVKGIPDRSKISPIPTERGQWEFGVHKHEAKRAGLHYDLRLGDKKTEKAYSWAIRHWPKPGEKRLAIRQPDHTIPYMDWTGTIPEGYGAGEVSLTQRGKANIKASKDKIHFKTGRENYTLVQTDGNNWLIIHHKINP